MPDLGGQVWGQGHLSWNPDSFLFGNTRCRDAPCPLASRQQVSIRAKGADLATLEPQVSVAILLPGRLHSSAPAGERLVPDLVMSPHTGFALWLVIFTVPMRPDTPFPGACRNWGSICAIRGPFVPLWGQIMGLGFGKWKHSPEMWSELGPRSTSFLCFVPRKETWLGLGVPRTGAEDTVRQRQAWNRHSSCPPQSLYKIVPGKIEKGMTQP